MERVDRTSKDFYTKRNFEYSMEQFAPSNFFDLNDYVHRMLFQEIDQVWKVFEYLESFLTSQKLGQINCPIPSGVFIENSHLVSIGEGSVIEQGAFIRGPCMLGKNSTIRHGAYIRGNVLAGNNCVIGHSTEVKNCIFLDHAKAPHFNYLGDSILGNRTNLGAGTICSNLKLAKDEINLMWKGCKIKTYRRKLGAIIGDGSQTGCNSVLNPGTFLEPGVFIYPGVNVSGIILRNHIVKPIAHPKTIRCRTSFES